MRQLFLIEIDGTPFGLAVHMEIGDVGQPPCSHFIEMIDRSECARIQQVCFHEPKGPLNFAFCLGPATSTSPWLKAIMSGESEELGVVDRLLSIPGCHHNFHAVVKTCSRQAV